MTRLLLVRHGETAWNAEGRLQGHGGVGLSERGHAQARAIAAYLRSSVPGSALIMRSDLLRVAETAAEAESLLGVAVRVDERLREIDVGTWTGLTFDEVAERDGDTLARWRGGHDVRRGGGETFAELRERVWQVLREGLRHADGTVVAFTHGGPIRVAVAAALELPPLGERRLAAVANGGICELLVDDGGSQLVRYNDVQHLDGV